MPHASFKGANWKCKQALGVSKSTCANCRTTQSFSLLLMTPTLPTWQQDWMCKLQATHMPQGTVSMTTPLPSPQSKHFQLYRLTGCKTSMLMPVCCNAPGTSTAADGILLGQTLYKYPATASSVSIAFITCGRSGVAWLANKL